MFSSLPRLLLRRAPGAFVLAGGAALAAGQQYQQPVRCNQAVRQNKGDVPIGIGKQFLQLYFAECADGSGKISLHSGLSFDQAKTMLQAAGAKAKQCKDIFDLMDTDSSGTVNFCEIMVFFLNHGTGSLQEKGSLFFGACDIDGSGSVEGAELKDIIHHMMLLKKEEDGIQAFTAGQSRLYSGIPATYILHFQANELVNDIVSTAGKGDSITEKQFQTWLGRGGKQVNRLLALFGM